MEEEKEDRVDYDEDGGELEVGAKRRPLPEVGEAVRPRLVPVARPVLEADVEEAELGDDHEDGLDEQVGLVVVAKPVDEAREVRDNQDGADVDREASAVVLLVDRPVLSELSRPSERKHRDEQAKEKERT